MVTVTVALSVETPSLTEYSNVSLPTKSPLAVYEPLAQSSATCAAPTIATVAMLHDSGSPSRSLTTGAQLAAAPSLAVTATGPALGAVFDDSMTRRGARTPSRVEKLIAVDPGVVIPIPSGSLEDPPGGNEIDTALSATTGDDRLSSMPSCGRFDAVSSVSTQVALVS
jgi:hypothetical protein